MRFIVIAALLCMLSSGANAVDETAKKELWAGTMDVGPRVFRFRIEAVTNEVGSAGKQLVSLDEGNQVFRLDEFFLDDANLKFARKISKATYSGVLSDDGRTSIGKWAQAGNEFDLTFHKVDAIPVDQPAEIWSGTIDALFQKLTLRVRVYRQDDGTESVYFDSVSQKASGFKATRTIEANQWTVDVASIGGTFKGTVTSAASEVNGKWTQGGVSLDLTLKPEKTMTDEAETAPNRPQTPKPPFPYAVEEVTFPSRSEGIQLAGTLTVPESSQPCRAVVMISGSGPQDRDETMLDHRPFWVIADHLSRHGIAVLRFDDRGTGASNGDFSTATSEDFSDDVEGAFDLLAKNPGIAAESIGLIGHSEGGLISPMVAARRNEVAFVVLLAGPGVNGKEILLSQGQLILRAAGVADESLLYHQRQTQLAIIDTILDAAPNASSETLVDAAMKRLAELLPEESLSEESVKATVNAGISRMNTPWFRFFLTYEPATSLEMIKCPVLAINGERDVQVDPKLNLPGIAAALEKGGNTHFRTIEFPAMNHLLQTCTTGGLNEYQSIEETISPVALQTITDWITSANEL